ncbi:MAG: hypothetical protein V2B14_02320 [bacterium]
MYQNFQINGNVNLYLPQGSIYGQTGVYGNGLGNYNPYNSGSNIYGQTSVYNPYNNGFDIYGDNNYNPYMYGGYNMDYGQTEAPKTKSSILKNLLKTGLITAAAWYFGGPLLGWASKLPFVQKLMSSPIVKKILASPITKGIIKVGGKVVNAVKSVGKSIKKFFGF